MYLFDLHCDTITRLHSGERLAAGDRSLRSNGAHIALDRMSGFEWCQCFAIFVPDEYRGEDASEYFEANYSFFCDELKRHGEAVAQAESMKDVFSAISEGKAAAMLTVEGGAVLGGDLSRIDRLAECGVRMLTLTWNGANELSGGVLSGGGLSEFGRQAIPLLEGAGIIVDVSHLSDEGFWELEKLAKKPFIASHSNARAICGHPRNLTDDQLRRIFEGGGLVGINLCRMFISEDKNADPTRDELRRHISHMLSLGGESCVALGADYDGSDVPSWLDPAEKLGELHKLILGEFGEDTADAIFFGNAAGFFARYELGERGGRGERGERELF